MCWGEISLLRWSPCETFEWYLSSGIFLFFFDYSGSRFSDSFRIIVDNWFKRVFDLDLDCGSYSYSKTILLQKRVAAAHSKILFPFGIFSPSNLRAYKLWSGLPLLSSNPLFECLICVRKSFWMRSTSPTRLCSHWTGPVHDLWFLLILVLSRKPLFIWANNITKPFLPGFFCIRTLHWTYS